MANKFRLAAFDLDGTVLAYGKGPSAATLEALDAAKAAGCRLVVCTGRPESLIPRSIWQIPCIDYVISAGGAMIRELKSNKVLSTIVLSWEAVHAVCAKARQSGAGLQIYFSNINLMDLKGWYRMHRYMRRVGSKEPFWKVRQSISREFSIRPSVCRAMQSSGGPVIKMVCIYRREEECKEFKESFQNIKDITAVSTMGIDIEITAGEAAKGHALGTLCRELEIDSRDVFAIGDSENDVSMRTYAGCLVAMGNAAQSLIDTADHITGSVHEDGAARAIRQYICGLE